MISRFPSQEKTENIICVLDNAYRISLYIKLNKEKGNEVIVSFNENNKRGMLNFAVCETVSITSLKEDKSIPDEIISSALKSLTGIDLGAIDSQLKETQNIYIPSEFDVRLRVNTGNKSYGEQTIVFHLDGFIGGWRWLDPHYGYYNVSYTITGDNSRKIPSDLRNGKDGWLGIANCSGFIGSLAKYEKELIRKAYDKYTGEWNKIAEIFLDETTETVISHLDYAWGTMEELANGKLKSKKKHGSFSNMVWWIITDPQLIKIDCPVDVYIYDESDNLCGSIVGNIPKRVNESVGLWVEGDSKRVLLLSRNEYQIKVIATDNGTMTYTVSELADDCNTSNRDIVFSGVPLIKGKSYS